MTTTSTRPALVVPLAPALLLAIACGSAVPSSGPPRRTEGPACPTWRALDGALTDWVLLWRRVVPGFTCAHFAADGTRPAPARPAPPRAGVSANVAPASTSRSPPTRDVDVLLGGADAPRPFVDLVEVGADRGQRVLECAAPCGFEDAAWLPGGDLVVAGWEATPSGPARAVLNVLDLEGATTTRYVGPEIDASTFRSWRQAVATPQGPG